ncbi:hypothetical protein MES4922_380010 [Mesorhizobium ventifaucium]|uniref:Uncharacterized protein n=1 Tax=Mesorhizobium ventifaucium TaxID=666020 RepID=A0ABM9E6X4_9HYPH|nr:hypothetical protein MES4922_380010 [Mesorhizobium ventifaucium]
MSAAVRLLSGPIPAAERNAYLYRFAGARTLLDHYSPVAAFLSSLVRFPKAPARSLMRLSLGVAVD